MRWSEEMANVLALQSRFYRGWSQEESAELSMLWRANYTSSQIAARLNRSRGSVLGKLHRMGMLGEKAA